MYPYAVCCIHAVAVWVSPHESVNGIVCNQINRSQKARLSLPDSPDTRIRSRLCCPSLTCQCSSHDIRPRPLRSFFPYTTRFPLSLSPVPKGFFSFPPFHSLKRVMSYRTDNVASYDRTLLSSVPDPTRAEKQVRGPRPTFHPFSRNQQTEMSSRSSLPIYPFLSLPRTTSCSPTSPQPAHPRRLPPYPCGFRCGVR